MHSGGLLERWRWLAPITVFAWPGAVHAQMRQPAFDHWSPPLIAAERAAMSDSVRVRVGYHTGRGALIGGAIGAGLGILAGAVFAGGECVDCGEQTSDAAYLAGGALVGGAAGAVIGLLFGLSSPKYEWRPVEGS